MEINESSDFKGAEKPNGFLITGLGASAGGIQALKEFFQHVPADSGIAYVVILHLSPDHDSQLAQVLQVVSSIPVLKVMEKTKIEPDHIYVVPPNQHLIIQDSFIAPSVNLFVEERRAPVDIFFRNLADTHGPRAVCVVLSGTGANGSMGLKRIKEMGGVAYVQNPREAEFNEMPRNSIATELVDEVLPVADIPAKIISYRNSLGTVEIVLEAEKRPEPQQQALREIFTLLRVRTGHDFSNYKRATLLRRIERRINVRSLPDLPAYAAFLQQNPDEAAALLKDLLISVTNFFRDSKAFEALEQQVLPAIFQDKKSEDQVRIWVAGCATGEEAYTVAMLCAERASGTIDGPKVQIFATDIDDAAIAIAREGYYTLNDAADVPPDRLRRFFNKERDGYRVRLEIRETIIFANHNFLKDPPFSRLDLVTCRNVLIYLNAVAQERVMETFHFALNPGGFLFLGSSESVDGASDLYANFNRDQHIYQAREVSSRNYPLPDSAPSFQFKKTDPVQKPDEKQSRPRTRITFGELHQRLLEQYAPPSIVVNEEYDIVHMSEKAGKYLEFRGGEPTQNLLKLVRSELRLELRSALYQAVQRKAAVEARDVKMPVNGHPKSLDLVVRPVLHDGDTSKGFILIIFQQKDDNHVPATIMISPDEPVARQLEEELDRVKTQLRNSVEQHEFQAEELKASNEELQAMNEELRSSAEELETSKEELQSINEELRTVNQELKVKIDETSVTSNNLQNLINSANVGTIFLDRSLCTRMFTPAVLEIFNLIPSDYGRPISDITHKLKYDGLLKDAETVLEKLTIVEREVATTDNRWQMMRLLPYRTSEDRINGVVITFFDITSHKMAEEALRQSEEQLRLVIESAKDYAILTQDTERRITSWSNGAEMTIGYSEKEIVGKLGDIIFTPEDRDQKVPEKEAEKADKEGRAENERWHVRKDGSRFWGSGSVSPIRNNEGQLLGFVKIMRDLTEQKQAEEALRQSEERLQKALSIDTVGVIYFNSKGFIHDSNAAFERMSGLSKETLLKGTTHWQDLTPPEFMEASQKAEHEILTQGQSTPYEKQYFRPDGSRWWGLFAGKYLSDTEFVEFVVDITASKKTEKALSHSEARLRTLANAVPQVIWTNNANGEADYFNLRWYEYSGLTYEQSEVLGWQAIVHVDDAPASVAKWKKALAAGEVFETEYRLRRHDGSYCWFIGRNVPLRDDSGKITGWFGSATDIENLKKTEEALIQSEARLRITMETATDYAIITMDTERRVERWSQGATLLFGYTEAEMIGQPADIIFTEEDRLAGVPQKEMETARDTGRAGDERWHRRKDGDRFFVSGVMRPIKSSELTGYVKVLRDMTQQQLFTEELTRLVNERTIELQRSNEDLRQFAHVASHDLKEPVRKVKTFNNRLNDEFGDLLPEKAKAYVKKIDASTERMFSMIEGVLAYSLIGKADKSIEPVDLNRTIDEIASVLEVLIAKKNATITKTELPTIKGNPTLMFQLFYNLILNSLKFSKEGEPSHINITSEQVKQEKEDFVKITLSDNGIGFEPEFEQVIFETFSRLNPLDEYEGTGLGLALCKKIVERHGGQISATGELGKGAAFTIVLPVR